MKTILTVIKINILAILSFPILLISILAMLAQKAVEKTIVFFGAGMGFLFLYFLNKLFDRPDKIVDTIATIVAVFFLFGIVILLFTAFLSVIVTIISIITTILIAIFSVVFGISHQLYSKLYDICSGDYKKLESFDKGKKKYFCVFWYLLTGFNKIVTTVLSNALTISVISSIGLVGYVIYYINKNIFKIFGIGIIEYLGLFSTTNSIFAILYVLVFTISAVAILISLGIEWSEWGKELSLATQNYSGYCNLMNERANAMSGASNVDYNFGEGKNIEKCKDELDCVLELFQNFDYLNQQVGMALSIKDDSSLNYEFITYSQILDEIRKDIESQGEEIQITYFEINISPKISVVKKKAREIEKLVSSILITQSNNKSENSGLNFFDGCDDLEVIQKRYKALCKIYHPDAGGHEETFKILQNQYESKMSAFGNA